MYLSTELTYKEVSRQLGIPTLGLLASWVNQFRMYGEIPERRKRGRPRKIKENCTMTIPSSSEANQRIKELEKQLSYAKIEVEYLKGLRRLENNVQTSKK